MAHTHLLRLNCRFSKLSTLFSNLKNCYLLSLLTYQAQCLSGLKEEKQRIKTMFEKKNKLNAANNGFVFKCVSLVVIALHLVLLLLMNDGSLKSIFHSMYELPSIQHQSKASDSAVDLSRDISRDISLSRYSGGVYARSIPESGGNSCAGLRAALNQINLLSVMYAQLEVFLNILVNVSRSALGGALCSLESSATSTASSPRLNSHSFPHLSSSSVTHQWLDQNSGVLPGSQLTADFTHTYSCHGTSDEACRNTDAAISFSTMKDRKTNQTGVISRMYSYIVWPYSTSTAFMNRTFMKYDPDFYCKFKVFLYALLWSAAAMGLIYLGFQSLLQTSFRLVSCSFFMS